MQNSFGAFYFCEFKPHNSNTQVMSIKIGVVSVFMPFNFAVLLSSRNKGHANIKEYYSIMTSTSFTQNIGIIAQPKAVNIIITDRYSGRLTHKSETW